MDDQNNNNNNNNSDPITEMNEINSDDNFNWSSSETGKLEVILKPEEGMSIDENVLLAVDSDNNILSKSVIKNSRAYFDIKVPYSEGNKVSLFYPNTANIQTVDVKGTKVYMDLSYSLRDNNSQANTSAYNYELKKKYYKNKVGVKLNTKQNMVQNPYFDINNLDRNNKNYNKLRTSGKWYYRDGNNISTSSVNGNNVFKNNRNSTQELSQSFTASSNTQYNFSIYYKGNVDIYIDEFDNSGKWDDYNYFPTSASSNGATKSGSFTTGSNISNIQFWIEISKNSYVDSVVLEQSVTVADSDNDGVNDPQDDYPNDASKAYKIMYPSTGYQTFAFEDLWPSTGDYDFNDIVISTKIEYATDAYGSYVSADFEVSLDACGSSHASGLGVNFLDAFQTTMSSDVINQVSGDAIQDPNVTNGIIVYTNHFDEQSTYYTNTSSDKVGTPEVFNFSVTFNQSKVIGFSSYYADLYYFRNDDRGHEIHMAGMPPTSAADNTLFGTYDDDPNKNYKTTNNLPWGIEVITSNKNFKHPKEKIQITNAYGQFGQWANSNGNQNQNWKSNYNNSKVFTMP